MKKFILLILMTGSMFASGIAESYFFKFTEESFSQAKSYKEEDGDNLFPEQTTITSQFVTWQEKEAQQLPLQLILGTAYDSAPLVFTDSSTFDFHLYLPKDFIKNPEKELPVFIEFYGAQRPILFSNNLFLSKKRILCELGYIVFAVMGEDWDCHGSPAKYQPESKLLSECRYRFDNFPNQIFSDLAQIAQRLKITKDKGGLFDFPVVRGKAPVILTGHSFGGYLTNICATSDFNHYFDGFISDAGAWDQAQIFLDPARHFSQRLQRQINHYFDQMPIDPENDRFQSTAMFIKNYLKDDQYNQEISPLFHLDKLLNPIHVIHGTSDARMPISQIHLLEGALKKHPEKAELISFHINDFDHGGPKNLDGHIKYYSSIENFVTMLTSQK